MNNIFSTTQIGLAHFNNKTLQENRDWKKEKEWDGAVYGFQYFIPDKIPYNTYLYIIEMNNDTNQIVGIGFIKKQQHTTQHHKHSIKTQKARIIITEVTNTKY